MSGLFGTSDSSSTSRPATGAERLDTFYSGLLGVGDATSGGDANVGSNDWTGYVNSTGGFNYPTYTKQEIVNPGSYSRAGSTNTASAKLSDVVNGGNSTLAEALAAAQSDASSGGYIDPGDAQTFGSYDELEQAILASRTAPLQRFETLQREAIDEDLAKRGIYSSGLAVGAQNDLSEALAASYLQAGSDAAVQRYGLESDELARLNEYALSRAGAENTFNLSESQAENAYNLSKAQYLTDASNTQETNYIDSLWRPLEWLIGLYNGTGGTFSSSSADSNGLINFG